MSYKSLARQGLTNRDCLSLEEMSAPRTKKPYGYCSSQKCCGREDVRKGILSTTNLSDDECPKCGHAIYWEWK